MKEIIGILGGGYIGAPAAVQLSKKYDVVLFDINPARIRELKEGKDSTGEIDPNELARANVEFTSWGQDLAKCSFFLVCVPTGINRDNTPDLGPLRAACETIGAVIQENAVVCFESTVYPGCTEEFCKKIIEQNANGTKFYLANSPERANPGDDYHTFRNTNKIISGDTPRTLRRVAEVYESVIDAKLHRAPSIKVAEAAKILENTQRDLNIALMNECSKIFHKIGIESKDVLEAAKTKWNFGDYRAGIRGGHCIRVDPSWLAYKALQVGVEPTMILAGRDINDGMAAYVVDRIKTFLLRTRLELGSGVGIYGAAFKKNVPDTRNSGSIDLRDLLEDIDCDVDIFDPVVAEDPRNRIDLVSSKTMAAASHAVVIYAQDHDEFSGLDLLSGLAKGGLFIDLTGTVDSKRVKDRGYMFWSL
jgi:UDP-N-acetyl-D-galactosamine dehydrogenase